MYARTRARTHVRTHARTHVRTRARRYKQKLCCLPAQTPDPAAGLHVGAQAQHQIHPRPEPMCWLASEASHSNGPSHLQERQAAYFNPLCPPPVVPGVQSDCSRSAGWSRSAISVSSLLQINCFSEQIYTLFGKAHKSYHMD